MHRQLNAATSRVRGEAGLSTLEALGLIAFVISLLAMIPFAREFAVNAIGVVFNQIDEDTGHINDFSVAMRGFAVAAGAVLAFIGSLALVLWTDVGKRLSFLLTGAAVFGWLTINGILFVVYAPRGIRPENLEGLNAFQMRLPSIALTVGAMVIMTMFLVALTRYEADIAE